MATIDVGRKEGAAAMPLSRELGPHLDASSPFFHNANGPKIGEGASPPFWGGGWVPI